MSYDHPSSATCTDSQRTREFTHDGRPPPAFLKTTACPRQPRKRKTLATKPSQVLPSTRRWALPGRQLARGRGAAKEDCPCRDDDIGRRGMGELEEPLHQRFPKRRYKGRVIACCHEVERLTIAVSLEPAIRYMRSRLGWMRLTRGQDSDWSWSSASIGDTWREVP